MARRFPPSVNDNQPAGTDVVTPPCPNQHHLQPQKTAIRLTEVQGENRRPAGLYTLTLETKEAMENMHGHMTQYHQSLLKKVHEVTEQEKKLNELLEKIDKVGELERKLNELHFHLKEKEEYAAKLEKVNAELHSKVQVLSLQNHERCSRKASECDELLRQAERSAEYTYMKPKVVASSTQKQIRKQPKKYVPMQEYDELMTNAHPNAILGQLEKAFTDPFDAKVVLTKIFMVAYEECKKQVILTITKPIEELFKVQSGLDVENEVEMENIRQVYGLLLELCASKTHLASARAMETICGKIKIEVAKLQHLEVENVKKKLQSLPLEKIVELTWKFVTENSPLIMYQPQILNEEIQQRVFDHWNENLPKPYTLIYARPVLYQSYDGHVARKGLVGNM